MLARHFGIPTPINTTEGKREFTALATELLPRGRAGEFNQAMMDFGAIQCTPQAPRCVACPLAETCVALRSGSVEALPVKLRRTKVQERRIAYIYIRCQGETAIRRRPAGDIWQGLWEPVEREEIEKLKNDEIKKLKNEEIKELKNEEIEKLKNEGIKELKNDAVLLAHDVRHVLTHRLLLADFYFLEVTEKPSLPEGYVWVPEAALDDYAKPRLIEKLLLQLPQSS